VSAGARVAVAGRELSLSNLDKILYPATGTTKGEVIDYYTRVAPALLPHLQARALTLKRYPDGVEAEYFYEKRCPSHRPPWVRVAPLGGDRRGSPIPYCVVDDLPTLVWVANLASIELHTALALVDNPDRPTVVVFDLDPGEPATVVECARVAQEIREVLDGLGLRCWTKSSGSKGMQVYAPLNTAATFDATKTFALAVARLLERRRPKEVVSEMRKDLRRGKVFIDWSQNDEHKTTVSVYSLRAMSHPTVSCPLTWDEVAEVADGDASLARQEAPAVLERVERLGDLFAPVRELRQELPPLAAA
jgi:bifunctional non-homologous end joining protein LigD